MEAPIHAANDVDKDENVPRIIAIVAGIAIAVVAAVAMVYSGSLVAAGDVGAGENRYDDAFFVVALP